MIKPGAKVALSQKQRRQNRIFVRRRMQFDKSFEALFNPGTANNFFEIAGLTDFEPKSVSAYSRTNALWLAEFSRLIYRQGPDELSPPPPNFVTRDAILQGKGWSEAAFFNQGGTQAGLFVKKDQCGALVFRGTLGLQDAITDLNFPQVRGPAGGQVHGGFKKAFDAIWQQPLTSTLAKLDVPLFLTGHSLGAALATLAASYCLNNPVLGKGGLGALYTFGSPRVGDPALGRTFDPQFFHCRIVNNVDVVPTLPPELPIPGIEFKHVGQLKQLDAPGFVKDFLANWELALWKVMLSGSLAAMKLLADKLEELRLRPLEPPLPLRDHTPVNYTAQIERTP
jgi:hypothetical protein